MVVVIRTVSIEGLDTVVIPVDQLGYRGCNGITSFCVPYDCVSYGIDERNFIV